MKVIAVLGNIFTLKLKKLEGLEKPGCLLEPWSQVSDETTNQPGSPIGRSG